MDAAAVLSVKTRLARLKHTGALTTDQFQLLKAQAKECLIPDQVFENLNQAWKLRCDGSVDEDEYEQDLRMILKDMQPGGSVSETTEPVAGSQGRLVLAAAPPRPASRGEKEKARAVAKSAAPGYQPIMNAFIKARGSRRLFEKTGLAITADGSDDNLINLEGMEGDISFLDAESTPEPFEDVLPASPAPADEEHPPGSSDEDDDSDEEGGGSRSGANDELTTLDVDDDLAEGEEPLPLEISTGYALVSSAPAALTAALVKRPTMLRLGIGWLKGTITRQSQARTRHLYDYRMFLDRDGSTHSVKLPLAKYSVDGSSREASWALLEDLAHGVESDKESEEEAGGGFEEEDEEEGEEQEEDEEKDGVDDAEPVERAKGQSWGKRKRVALGGGVVSTARSSSRACMPNVRLTDQ